MKNAQGGVSLQQKTVNLLVCPDDPLMKPASQTDENNALEAIMKPQRSRARITSLVLGLALGALIIPSASAYTVYKLEEGLYAIICQDGTINSYSGGPGGIGIVGEALCDGHGGVVGGGGGIDVLPADRQLARSVERCQQGRGEQVQRNATKCIDKASPKLMREAKGGGGGAGKVSIQEMERSRD